MTKNKNEINLIKQTKKIKLNSMCNCRKKEYLNWSTSLDHPKNKAYHDKYEMSNSH